jgi:MerR family transcriptional regulator, copper efflux regulator
MGRDGLLIGEVASRSGVSRKALRLYEESGILPAPGRTEAGYRIYGPDTFPLLAFITQARQLGLRLSEIKQIVQIKRSGRAPCPRVLELLHHKVRELDRALVELAEVRRGLQRLLRSPRSAPRGKALVCAHIEGLTLPKERR